MKNVQKLLSASVSFTLGALITPFTAWAEVTSDPLMPSAKDLSLCSLGGEHLLGALALLASLSWISLKYQDTQVQSWTLFPICLLSLGCLLAQGLLVYLQTIPLSWASNWNLELSSKTVSQKMLKKKKIVSQLRSHRKFSSSASLPFPVLPLIATPPAGPSTSQETGGPLQLYPLLYPIPSAPPSTSLHPHGHWTVALA